MRFTGDQDYYQKLTVEGYGCGNTLLQTQIIINIIIYNFLANTFSL